VQGFQRVGLFGERLAEAALSFQCWSFRFGNESVKGSETEKPESQLLSEFVFARVYWKCKREVSTRGWKKKM
jgi:hypothetical protein